jgi:hypothetical protein
VNKDAQCMPILPLSLSFRADREGRCKKIRLVDAAGRRGQRSCRSRGDGIDRDVRPGLPERSSSDRAAEGSDDAPAARQRESFPLRVRTDENPPLAKFAADFGILERVLPARSRCCR